MSYLLDKKIKRKKVIKIFLICIFLILLFLFKKPIAHSFSNIAHFIFKPVMVVGNNVKNNFSNLSFIFSSKKNLLKDKKNLELKLTENEFSLMNYNSILNENEQLKEILGRKKENTDMILGTILSKPNNSLYDILIIDIGKNSGLFIGQRVFALGDLLLGYIGEVENNSAKVILYSNPGEKTQVVTYWQPDPESVKKSIFLEVIGRGGGNFEMILPKDIILEKYTEVVLPGINPYLLAKVVNIISDPQNSLQKALLISPVNIQELKFVQVEK